MCTTSVRHPGGLRDSVGHPLPRNESSLVHFFIELHNRQLSSRADELPSLLLVSGVVLLEHFAPKEVGAVPAE